MSYLELTDVTDSISRGVDMQPYLLEGDDAIVDLAERLGVRDPDDIESDPLHYKVRRYGVAWAMSRFCQDRIGASSPEVSPETNKYFVMYGVYKREVQDLETGISYEMMSGTVSAIRDRANHVSVTLFRG